jgi:HD-GYP domain-containing protein (c-di-GMP phosphodiesterase class II)
MGRKLRFQHLQGTEVGNQLITLWGVSREIDGLRWESNTLLRIGRQSSCEVVVHHASISRQHAEVVVRGQGGVVRDLGSTKGTFLNGVPVGGAYQKLRQDDVLQCGDLTMRVTFSQEEVRPPPRPVETPAEAGEPGSGAAHFRASGLFLRIQATTPPASAGDVQEKAEREQTLEGVPPCGDEAPRKGNHLHGLLRMGHYLAHLNSLDELLRVILDDTVAILDAQRGCIILADEATGQLDLHAISFSKQPMSASKTFSRTLAQHCFQQDRSLLCRDVNIDKELQRAGSIAYGSMASIICVLLRSPRKRLGVLHLDRGPFQEPFTPEDLQMADAIAANISFGIENAQLAETQRELFVQTVTALAQAVELRDHYTGNHTQRVTQYSLMLAHELQLSAAERQHIQIGTPLHDIGKIAIDDAILRKPGRLTPEEFEQMKTHVVTGAAILESIPGMKPMLPIVRNHHERWDGTGYPDGLAGEAIPRLARIVAVADAFDAMTSDRPYRRALSLDRAFAELNDKAGTHFDPDCIRAFLRLRQRVEMALAQPSAVSRLCLSLDDSELQSEVLRLLNNGSPLRATTKT